jgi:hypothetical protein
MSVRALFAVAVTIFALPAGATEPARLMPVPAPPGAPEPAGPAVCFEVRVLKAPVGFSERIGLTGDTLTLSDAQLRRALEAAQGPRDATIMQLPKVTVDDGTPAQVRTCETRYFVTGVEATSVKGATVLVPKNKPIELGDSLTIAGTVSADGTRVRVAGGFTRVRVEGNVQLVPVTTQITPVFEGGSQGGPIPSTQFFQVPDVRTEKVEKTAIVPAGSTLVLGGWKETEPAPAPTAKVMGLLKRENKEKLAEYEVVVLATARVLPSAPAPAPR